MGVDWYPCSICNETFPDCGDYSQCICEDQLCTRCGKKMIAKYGSIQTEDYGFCCNGCDNCQLPSETQILQFALELLGKTQEQVVSEMDFKPPTAKDFDLTVEEEEEEDDEE